MDGYKQAYERLNTAQRKAVDTIDGPVLVLAGPGTGKTQLLTMRVAQILRTTDASPENILCLTFTESGAANMRARLATFIGRESYDVAMSTYHAFGGDIIRKYPDYFEKTRLERPVDELGKHTILAKHVESLDYRNPLKQTRWHIGDLISTISEVKRALLTPEKLRTISNANHVTIKQVSPRINDILAEHAKRLPSKAAVAIPLFEAIHAALLAASKKETTVAPFLGLSHYAAEQLAQAIEAAEVTQKTTPLTRWKNNWLVKDEHNAYALAGTLESRRTLALADLLEQYEATLATQGLYDFDDMILHAIHMLETNPDLKYTLQERYQYILLDEFQDTNASQLRLVELLTDNPVHEGRPNVLAVGDDDQAIYAFQGAQYSNMRDFLGLYNDIVLINLSENYRSTKPILETARAVAAQLTDSLSASIPGLDKQLIATRPASDITTLLRLDYPSDIAERAGVAERIKALIAAGVEPGNIAVLAPKHKYLEPLIPYLQGTPVQYEKRENILEAPVIKQLLTMGRLVASLAQGHSHEANRLWPEVLSYDFWEFPVSAIWQLSWQAQADKQSWAQALLASETFRPAALLFLTLAGQINTQTLESMLDMLIGTESVETHEPENSTVSSPLKGYLLQHDTASELYNTANHLAVLRARLREYSARRGSGLLLADLLAFADEYEAAGQQLLNTSPYNEAASAVQLMTAYKAKGLEFEHVFVLQCHDDAWGNAARSNGNKLTLPMNLAPIRHAGGNEDERLRLFYVALTRAKSGLYLTSHARNFAGKQPPRLKFLNEIPQENGETLALTLPEPYQQVVSETATPPTVELLETDWRTRHLSLDTALISLLQERLASYRFSPTHLTSFIDLEHAGPQAFLMNTLLRFPSATTPDLGFGNAMHETMQWLQLQANASTSQPSLTAAQEYFASRIQLQSLTPEQVALQQARGEHALEVFLASDQGAFTKGNRAEYDFRDEGVFVGDVPLAGKIDLLQINTTDKTIHIVDYKTGSLRSDPAKLHRYTLQLYCYALLVSKSRSFRNYSISGGSLVFVEPDNEGAIKTHTISFTESELARIESLITAIWNHIQAVDMPDISGYASTLTAIKQFEKDLIDGTI